MTVIKHKEQRVGVFIDTQNLYHSARNLYQGRVNFGAVLKEAVAGRKLVRAVAYVITTEAGDEKNFFEALTKFGIETKTKDLQIFAGGAKKAARNFATSSFATALCATRCVESGGRRVGASGQSAHALVCAPPQPGLPR